MTISKLQNRFLGCPLCSGQSTQLASINSSQHSLWHEPLPNNIDWMRCSQCGHVYTKHYWSEAGLAEVFRNSHSSQLAVNGSNPDANRVAWLPVVQNVVRLLRGYDAIKNHTPIWLDVGCGNGALVMTAADFGFKSFGLDARQEAVTRINELGYKAVKGNFLEITFDGQADVLSMMDVLEHLPYPRQALLKAKSLLVPGGLIVISMPDLSCSSWRLMDSARANPYWIELEHHHNFSRERVMALLVECGFDVIDFTIPLRYKAQMEVYARLPG